jgi:hypothetical protein
MEIEKAVVISRMLKRYFNQLELEERFYDLRKEVEKETPEQMVVNKALIMNGRLGL